MSDTVIAAGLPVGSALVTPVGGTQQTLAQALGAGVPTVPSAAGFANLSPLVGRGLVYLLGYASSNDGGQGFFMWQPGDNRAADGGTIFATSASGGLPGPNIFPNPASWTVTGGSPVIGANGQSISDAGTEFWQTRLTINGLTVGASYIMSWDYTLAATPTGGYTTINGGYALTPAATPSRFSFPFTAATASILTIAAGQAAANSISNISVALAPGGRWVRVLDEPGVCHPEWWGALGNNVADDTTPINSAIAWASQFLQGGGLDGYGQRGLLKFSPGKIYKCNGAWSTINPLAMSVLFQGAGINFAACTAPYPVVISGSGGSQPWGNDTFRFSGGIIHGNPSLSPFQRLKIAGLSGDQIAHIELDHMMFPWMDMEWDSYTYFITLRKCFTGGIISVNSPFDSGEENNIDTCVIGWIDWQQTSGGSCFIQNSSIDYNPKLIQTRGGSLRFRDCHFETNSFNPSQYLEPEGVSDWLAPMTCIGPASELRFDNCEFVWTGGVAPPLFYCTTPAPYGIKLIDPLWGGGSGWGRVGPTQRLTVVQSSIGLDPAKTNSNLVLSNGSLTAKVAQPVTFPTASSTFTNAGELKGKWYFSLAIDAMSTAAGGGVQLGLVQFAGGTGNLGNYPDINVSYSVNTPAQNGIWFLSALRVAFTPVIVPGTVWWIFVDFAATLFWFSDDNGVTWNHSATASPGTGAGGVNFGALLSGLNTTFPPVLAPAAGLSSLNDQVTFNFNPDISGLTGVSGFAGNPWSQAFTLIGGGNVQISGSRSGNNGATTSYPPLTDVANSLDADPTFENGTGTTFLDAWSLTQDSAGITSRVTGTNIGITIGTTKPHTGLQSLEAVKAGAATTLAAFGLLYPCRVFELHSGGFWYAASANSLGTTRLNIRYVQLLYYGAGGVPFFGQSSTQFTANLTPTTTYQQAFGNVIQPSAPAWATHVLFEFDMKAMAAGTLYLDDAEFYRW
jgi:hypothetical protein